MAERFKQAASGFITGVFLSGLISVGSIVVSLYCLYKYRNMFCLFMFIGAVLRNILVFSLHTYEGK
jgi:hypothetical protein